MTRLIERWFPCEEVSENSKNGWGSGNAEKKLFPWFAARPLAQAKAAVICSLLPWPDEPSEQERLRGLVRNAMKGYDAAHDKIVAEINKYYPHGASILDPFSGRGMIPLEAARLKIKAWGIDYSPVATLAGTLLADYPMRDWSFEPPFLYKDYEVNDIDRATTPRLLFDVKYILDLIGSRYESEMDAFYPKVDGKRPWGYLWAITLPCVNCNFRFPMTASLELRKPNFKKDDFGQSYYFEPNTSLGLFRTIVHKGEPRSKPTLVKKNGVKGKVAVCLFCEHVHPFDVHTRLMGDLMAEDVLLVVADIDDKFGKIYREPSTTEIEVIRNVNNALQVEAPFASDMPAIPNERALGSTGPRDYTRYGCNVYGDFWNPRQTLGLIKLSRIINEIGNELLSMDISDNYVSALSGYATSVMARKICRSTRGGYLGVPEQSVSHIFKSGAPVPFGYDYFETGCGKGPGTWTSISKSAISSLSKQVDRVSGLPAVIQQGSALALPMPNSSLDAVVTDPPYEAMVEYSDASDLFYVWLKRSLIVSHPEFAITTNLAGVQDKIDEAVVKMTWKRSGDHRTPGHYYNSITRALEEAKRTIKPGGVVSIMFGHDDLDVLKKFFTAIDSAGLMLTGSWPALTEYGSQMNKANIETTLTLACRELPPNRPGGRMLEVDSQVRREVMDRIGLWKSAGLSLLDQRMASYGPAMEIVGRYSEIRDKGNNKVSIERYLAKARLFVIEAAEIKIGDIPLEKFDLSTRFILFWVGMYGRDTISGSEVRWLRLGWDLTVSDTDRLLMKDGKGFRFVYASEFKIVPIPESSVIDIVLAVAGAGKTVEGIADVLYRSDSIEDPFLWETMDYLAQQVPVTDRDGDVWTWAVRNRNTISGSSQDIEESRLREQKNRKDAGVQQGML